LKFKDSDLISRLPYETRLKGIIKGVEQYEKEIRTLKKIFTESLKELNKLKSMSMYSKNTRTSVLS